MRFSGFLFACLVALVAPTCAWAGGCGSGAAAEKARLKKVDARLDITLADGRVVFFPSIDPPRATPDEPDLPQEAARQLASLLQGKTLIVSPLGGADRWGRIPARLFPDGASESADETSGRRRPRDGRRRSGLVCGRR